MTKKKENVFPVLLTLFWPSCILISPDKKSLINCCFAPLKLTTLRLLQFHIPPSNSLCPTSRSQKAQPHHPCLLKRIIHKRASICLFASDLQPREKEFMQPCYLNIYLTVVRKQALPKIREDCRSFPRKIRRCLDQTPTNLSTVMEESMGVIQGYSRDAWLAEFVFRETRIYGTILGESWSEGFTWPVNNFNYLPVFLVSVPLYSIWF